MTDELTVQVGYRVSTEEQAAHAVSLAALEADLIVLTARLAGVDRISTPFSGLTGYAFVQNLRAEIALDNARYTLLLAIGAARHARVALEVTAAAYAEVDRRAQELARAAGSALAYGLGLLGPLALPWLLSPLLAATSGLGLTALMPGGADLLADGASLWWRENRHLLSDPVTVELIRAAVMGSDEAIGGALRVPPGLVAALGEHGLDITGVSTSAALLVALVSRSGALREAPVAVTRVSAAAATPPRGFRERVARIPRGVPQQVRVERYPVPGKPARVEVFIGGTVDWSLVAGEQPWDMTSNAHAAAAVEPASLRAVRDAMTAAGVQPEDRIAITGHSQGALVGAQLAASHEYRVDFLLELGGPSGQVPVPESVTHVRLDHTSDLVTALGGDVRSESIVQIRRDGVPPDTGLALPAHNLDFYMETAELADRSRHPQITTVIAEADAALTPGSVGEATEWRARRLLGDAVSDARG